MAKFFGKVGYGHSVEDPDQNGVWEDAITERYLYGDVERNTRRLTSGDRVNSNLTTTTTISVLADTYALENIFAIRYVEWMGALWVVDNVDSQRPRLILSLGEVYHGPTPTAASNSGAGAGQ